MQFVNDDMDELFRRAAENYPLKKEGADWNKVLQQLQVGETGKEKGPSKNNKKHLLWLLLLLPLPFICNKYMGSYTQHQQVANVEGKTKQPPTMQVYEEPGANQPAAVKEDLTLSKKVAHNEEGPLKQQQESKRQNGLLSTKSFSEKANKEWAGNKTKSNERQLVKNKKGRNNFGISNKNEKKDIANAPFKSRLDPITTKQKTAIGSVSQENNVNPNDTVLTHKEKQNDASAVDSITQSVATNTVVDTTASTTPQPAKKIKPKRIYVGVIAGPDISKIKSSKVQGTGFSAGIIAGYNISKRWSVEAGLLWDKKKYYAEGKYFDTSKMMLPLHSKIINGDGDCRMIEIPLNVRYHFAEAQGHQLFASAGLTSYLMMNEEYNYLYYLYGSSYYTYKEYNNASRDWLSVMTVSMGYQKKLGHIGNLRIEPYLKLPLRGVGIGKLPMSSGGVYIGITRPIR